MSVQFMTIHLLGYFSLDQQNDIAIPGTALLDWQYYLKKNISLAIQSSFLVCVSSFPSLCTPPCIYVPVLHTFCCFLSLLSSPRNVQRQICVCVCVFTCSRWKMSRRCSSPRLFKNWLMVMSSRAAETQWSQQGLSEESQLLHLFTSTTSMHAFYSFQKNQPVI